MIKKVSTKFYFQLNEPEALKNAKEWTRKYALN